MFSDNICYVASSIASEVKKENSPAQKSTHPAIWSRHKLMPHRISQHGERTHELHVVKCTLAVTKTWKNTRVFGFGRACRAGARRAASQRRATRGGEERSRQCAGGDGRRLPASRPGPRHSPPPTPPPIVAASPATIDHWRFDHLKIHGDRWPVRQRPQTNLTDSNFELQTGTIASRAIFLLPPFRETNMAEIP